MVMESTWLRGLGFLVVVGVLGSLRSCEGASWSYKGADGVDAWSTNFPDYCNGQSQSPIDLRSSNVYYDDKMQPFNLDSFDTLAGVTWEMNNNGHSATVTFTTGDLEVKGGSLGGVYKVEQFHFHWGSDSTKGSEHTVDTTSYPMEVHIVCSNKRYSGLGEAVTKNDGLAVLGYFYEIAPNDNPTMQKLIDSFPQIKYSGNRTSLTPFKLNDLIAGYEDFYRYQGGLTTPTCNEVVTWTVFKNTIKISETQMRAFRGLMDSHSDPLVDNYRPVQLLNDRSITASFKDENFASSSPTLLLSLLSLAASLLMSLGLRL